MTETHEITAKTWTIRKALVMATVCLMLGTVSGWLIRGIQSPALASSPQTASAPAPGPSAVNPSAPASDPAHLKLVADQEAAPLLEKLKSDPTNAGLLTNIGNLYYDAQQYPIAVDYYGRALNAQPSNANVRTDMGTAYWYMGHADEAIAQFNQALSYQPENSNTLFNRGLVKWQGKRDGAGAIADWKKLLATNPNYEAKEKVDQMLAEVEKQTAAHP